MKLSRIPFLLVVALVLIFGFQIGLSSVSSYNMSRPEYITLGILLIAAILWMTEAVPLFVTSLLVLFLCLVWLAPALRAEGLIIENGRFLAPFFSDIILLFLGGFVLSAGLHKLHLDEWLARWIIRKTGQSIPRLMIGIMLVTAFLSMWLSNTATAAMMLALVIPITNRLSKDDRYRQALLLSIPFAANVGGLGTPIGSPPNAIALQYMKQIDLAPSFGMWMLIGVPGVLVMLGLVWSVLLVLYKGQSSGLPKEEPPSPPAATPALYTVLLTILLTVSGWMTSALHGQSSGTVALIPVLVFFATGILDVKDLKSLSWDVLLLMGGGLCLGTAISESGLADWLVGLLPVEGVSVYWLMVMFGSVACLMSCVMSNTATANLVMPIILGLNTPSLSPMLIGTAFACSLAMPLPVSTPPNAMAFSSGQLTVGHMVKPGLLITLIGVVLMFTTGYWWWNLIGLF